MKSLKKSKMWYAVFSMCSGHSVIALGIQGGELVSWGAACINYFYKANFFFRQLWTELLVELGEKKAKRDERLMGSWTLECSVSQGADGGSISLRDNKEIASLSFSS